MAVGRVNGTAVLLRNGRVLVAGGGDGISDVLASAELYDPASGTWSVTGSMVTARFYQTMTLRRKRRGHVWQHSRQRGTRRSCRAVNIPMSLEVIVSTS